MGKESINGKNLTVQNVNDVISQYLIDVIADDWNSYFTNQQLIDSHLKRHESLVKVSSGALEQRIRNALWLIDKDAIPAENKRVYEAIERWLRDNTAKDNLQDLLKIFIV